MNRTRITSKLPSHQTEIYAASLYLTLLAIPLMMSRCHDLRSNWTSIPNNATGFIICNRTSVSDVIFVIVGLNLNVLFVFQETTSLAALDIILIAIKMFVCV
jgi:hypothetical protein